MPATRLNHRLLVGLFVLLGLAASACGTAERPQELNASSLQPDSAAEPVPWNVEPTVAPLPDKAASVERSAHSPGSEVPATEVLALAFAAPESLSYTFTQGMSMEMDMAGLVRMSIAPREPIARGEVAGSRSHMEMDIGLVMREMFDSLDAGTALPAELDSLTMEMWADETTLIMDMSSMANSLGAIDPATASELAVFADGPVSIDLTQLPGLNGSDLANQFTQGSQVVDPVLLLKTLRSVDALRSVGAVSANGRSLETYDATITMAQYYDALGIDPADQMDMLGGLGVSSEEESMINTLFDAMNNVPVEMHVQVDEDQLIRRLETEIDMQPLMQAVVSDPNFLSLMATEEGATVAEMEEVAELMNDLEFTIGTWQEFENYGEAFVIELPDATDVTNQIAGMTGVVAS